MPYYEMFPQGIPASLKTEMNTVLNKKFGTTGQDYPTEDWPEDVNLLGLLEIKTASSAPVCSFEDGADDVPTSSVKVTIPPTLSGVSSVTETQTGRNIVNVTFSDYNASNIISNAFSLKAGTYTLSLNYIGTPTCGIYLRDGSAINSPVLFSKYNDTSLTFTLSEDKATLCFTMYYANGISSSEVSNVQLEYGSTAHDYEPYTTPTTHTASLGRTIYGGEVDIVNGTGQETHKEYTASDVTSLYWNAKKAEQVDTNHRASFRIALPSGYITINNSLCYGLPYRTDIASGSGANEGYQLIATAGIYFCIDLADIGMENATSDTPDQDFLDAIHAYGNNLVICVELATPTDFTFDGQEVPTRLGYNAFWSDEGDTEVTYRSSGTETIITPVLVTKAITSNGTYSAADDSADGYSSVTVNVPSVPSGSHEDPLNGLSAVKYNTGMVFSGFYIDNGTLKTELAFESRAATGYEGFQIDLSNYNLVPGTNYVIEFSLYVPNDISFNGSYPWGIKYSSTAITNPAGSSFNITPDVDFLEQTGTQSVTMQFTASSNNYLLVLFSRYANGTLGKVTILRDITLSEVTP